MTKKALLQQSVMPRCLMGRVKDIVFRFARCEHPANTCDLSSNQGMPVDIHYKMMYLIR